MAGFRRLPPTRILALASECTRSCAHVCACVCVGRLCFLLLMERGQVDQLEQRDQPNGHHCQQRDSMTVVAKEYEE